MRGIFASAEYSCGTPPTTRGYTHQISTFYFSPFPLTSGAALSSEINIPSTDDSGLAACACVDTVCWGWLGRRELLPLFSRIQLEFVRRAFSKHMKPSWKPVGARSVCESCQTLALRSSSMLSSPQFNIFFVNTESPSPRDGILILPHTFFFPCFMLKECLLSQPSAHSPASSELPSEQQQQSCNALAWNSPRAPRSRTLLPPPRNRCRTSDPRRAP